MHGLEIGKGRAELGARESGDREQGRGEWGTAGGRVRRVAGSSCAQDWVYPGIQTSKALAEKASSRRKRIVRPAHGTVVRCAILQ